MMNERAYGRKADVWSILGGLKGDQWVFLGGKRGNWGNPMKQRQMKIMGPGVLSSYDIWSGLQVLFFVRGVGGAKEHVLQSTYFIKACQSR